MVSVAQLTRWLRQAASLEDDQHKSKRKIFRPGKTTRDRRSGAWQQRLVNRMARADAQNNGSKK